MNSRSFCPFALPNSVQKQENKKTKKQTKKKEKIEIRKNQETLNMAVKQDLLVSLDSKKHIVCFVLNQKL